MRVAHLAAGIEERVTGLYNQRLYQLVGGNEQLDMQVYRLREYLSDKELRFEDHVSEHLKPGDTVIADAQAMLFPKEPCEYTEQDLENFRRTLRFGLNDRVL